MFDTTAIVPFKAFLSRKASPFHRSSRHIDLTTLTATSDIATVHRYAQHPSAIHAFDHLSPQCRPRQHLPTRISPPTKARNRLPSDFAGNGTSYRTLPPHITMLMIPPVQTCSTPKKTASPTPSCSPVGHAPSANPPPPLASSATTSTTPSERPLV